MRLNERRRQAELMDDPALDAAVHRHALRSLQRVNWWSQTDRAIWERVRTVPATDPSRCLRILDIASGGGDLAICLARRFQKANIAAQIEGLDISEEAVGYANEQAEAAGATNVRFSVHNALTDVLPDQSWDVVMCSLFLHHLERDDGVLLLNRMKNAARQLVLIDDLRRTAAGYWLAWIGCRLLTRCSVVHVDGPMSVEGAFSTREAMAIAVEAGMAGCQIQNHWPQRFLLEWRRTP